MQWVAGGERRPSGDLAPGASPWCRICRCRRTRPAEYVIDGEAFCRNCFNGKPIDPAETLGAESDPRIKKIIRTSKRPLAESQREEVRTLRMKDKTLQAIAKRFGVGVGTIHRIVSVAATVQRGSRSRRVHVFHCDLP
jgi:DNA-directed RNA polymerase specialized sigma24 family protein